MATPPPDKHLRTTEERLARLSVLQELTVAALDLFAPESSPDPFLERLAERMGCLAALWVVMEPGHRVTLHGAAGLAEASRSLAISTPPPGDPVWKTLPLPYPELARTGLTRWHFRLDESAYDGKHRCHALLLVFDSHQQPQKEYLPAVERLVAVLRTVLTHRRMAEDLQHSYQELARAQLALIERERLAAIGELAAVVAHEVRNPLAVIFNCIGTLEKKGPPAGEAKALLDILAEEANRLNQIVSELLDFARPGAVMLQPESLEEVVGSAIAAVESAQTDPAATIELHVARPLPPLLLDRRLVRRAVINLISNAVQAMPGGGTVVVNIKEDATDRGAVRIEVADTGPGIPRAALERIFEPFFTTKAFGTGLGLSIVRHAAEAHQGELTVRSDEGRGTTFTIRLPAPSSPAPEA